MSSRNAYLSAEDRQRAATLSRAMKAAIAEIEAGAAVDESLRALTQALLAGGFSSVDYAELADAESLELLTQRPARPARLLVAARIGGTRLIDNMAVAAAPPREFP